MQEALGVTDKQISVLFVCMGNICRSPLAEGVFAQRSGQRGLARRLRSASGHFAKSVATTLRAGIYARSHRPTGSRPVDRLFRTGSRGASAAKRSIPLSDLRKTP